ncbi:MAG TPA: HAD-IA family hydrolase [Actinomycetota bacterium]|jgi:putative hydrolase of the HAD superfamily|nr:HAD-IA family hydrolase [Actinomycetota bacterium]
MTDLKAVLFDLGGVILTSPFEAFAGYERDHGLPSGFIRSLNATNSDDNAWARLERNAVPFEEFCRLFEAEARAAGHDLDAAAVMRLLAGEIRPAMVTAVRRCQERLRTAALTNNFTLPDGDPAMSEVRELFDVIVESSRIGVRKPDPRFYELACAELGVAPGESVFLDDLGINLKPARALGMTTIKVDDPARAIAELEAVVGFPLG